jgi:hypothetical protein
MFSYFSGAVSSHAADRLDPLIPRCFIKDRQYAQNMRMQLGAAGFMYRANRQRLFFVGQD